MKTTHFYSFAAVALVGAGLWPVLSACGDGGTSTFDGPRGPSTDGGPGGSTPVFPGDVDNGPYSDFPKEPIIDLADGGGGMATPANAAALFASGGAESGDGSSPCLLEPEIGSIVPRNWLRPRFRWTEAGDANIFEIRVHAANQINDLVVYTTRADWTMPSAMWSDLALHSADVDITIAVRGGKLEGDKVSGIAKGSNGAWRIAPADAPGSIVYWRITGGDAAELKGFVVGDDTVRLALQPSKVEQKAGTQCIGCHIASPDGKYAIFSSKQIGNEYGLGIASIEPATEGKKPDFMTASGQKALEEQVKGTSTVNSAFWNPGRHLVVSVRDGDLRWINLDATSDGEAMGVIARTGDPNARPSAPNFAHDGSRLVYTSGPSSTDGRPEGGGADIYVVPFNDGAGGAATKLAGAAADAFNEYYPTFSPDDRLVAFSRAGKDDGAYAQAKAEIFVVPGAGGEAQRLAANDPPACSKKTSPGVENSWPKWAPAKPAPTTVNGKTYYWLIFSSTRLGGDQRQLFMAPVVVGADGKVEPYKSVYLWNQPADEKNHTPAWDTFALPSSVN